MEPWQLLETKHAILNLLTEDLAQASKIVKSSLIEKIYGISSSNGVTVSRIYFQSPDVPILLFGQVASEDGLTAFKNGLMGDSEFDTVNLALSDIHQEPTGINFSITFRLHQ